MGAPASIAPDTDLGIALQKKLSTPEDIANLDIASINVLYIPGGHGCLIDVNQNKIVQEKILEAYRANKVIAAVCHGSSALAFVRENGASIVKDKKITGFPDILDSILLKLGWIHPSMLPLPYKNEEKMIEAGAKITPLDTTIAILNPLHHVVDHPFVTGVGPKSAEPVIKKVITIYTSQ